MEKGDGESVASQSEVEVMSILYEAENRADLIQQMKARRSKLEDIILGPGAPLGMRGRSVVESAFLGKVIATLEKAEKKRNKLIEGARNGLL